MVSSRDFFAAATGTSDPASSSSRMMRRPRAPTFAFDRHLGDRFQRIVGESQLDVLVLEQPLVLLDQGVLRTCQNFDERRSDRDRGGLPTTGTRPTNSGIIPNLIRSSGSTLFQKRRSGLFCALHSTSPGSPSCFAPQAVFDHLVETDERSAADEQDVRRIDLRELLMRMFSAALRRNISDGSFQHLQQSLLNAFAGNIAGDRGVFVLSADLVDLIYIDDAGLGPSRCRRLRSESA